jgi:hypothetical protein
MGPVVGMTRVAGQLFNLPEQTIIFLNLMSQRDVFFGNTEVERGKLAGGPEFPKKRYLKVKLGCHQILH